MSGRIPDLSALSIGVNNNRPRPHKRRDSLSEVHAEMTPEYRFLRRTMDRWRQGIATAAETIFAIRERVLGMWEADWVARSLFHSARLIELFLKEINELMVGVRKEERHRLDNQVKESDAYKAAVAKRDAASGYFAREQAQLLVNSMLPPSRLDGVPPTALTDAIRQILDALPRGGSASDNTFDAIGNAQRAAKELKKQHDAAKRLRTPGSGSYSSHASAPVPAPAPPPPTSYDDDDPFGDEFGPVLTAPAPAPAHAPAPAPAYSDFEDVAEGGTGDVSELGGSRGAVRRR